jgi:hypothetical protein
MLPFSDHERALWEQAGQASLHDTCLLLIPPDSQPDAFGYQAEGNPSDWHQEGPYSCGIRLGDPDDSSGTIRLPSSLIIPDRARIKITHRRGEAIPALLYSITEGPRFGVAVQTLKVRREEGMYPL